MQSETDAVGFLPSGAPTNNGEKTEARPPTGGGHLPKSSEGSGSGPTAPRELSLCPLCSARVRPGRMRRHLRKAHQTRRDKRRTSGEKRQTGGKVPRRPKKRKR